VDAFIEQREHGRLVRAAISARLRDLRSALACRRMRRCPTDQAEPTNHSDDQQGRNSFLINRAFLRQWTGAQGYEDKGAQSNTEK
jgi:hypothetical protein